MSRAGGAKTALDLPTVLAIGVTAYVAAKVLHEGLGHGLSCALLGGDLKAVSSSWCDCEREALGVGANRLIKAAGTVMNLLGGGLAYGLLVRRPEAGGVGRYALWMFAAVNLLMGAGYLMVDPVFRFGDWGAFLEGLPRSWGPVISAVGLALSLGCFFALMRRLDALAGGDGGAARAVRLTLLPWLLVGGLFMTAAALRNSLGAPYAVTSALATVGGTSMLAWMPLRYRTGKTARTVEPLPIVRSRAWLALGAAVAAFTLLAFGPGIRFD